LFTSNYSLFFRMTLYHPGIAGDGRSAKQLRDELKQIQSRIESESRRPSSSNYRPVSHGIQQQIESDRRRPSSMNYDYPPPSRAYYYSRPPSCNYCYCNCVCHR
jgi:hypothetical protein